MALSSCHIPPKQKRCGEPNRQPLTRLGITPSYFEEAIQELFSFSLYVFSVSEFPQEQNLRENDLSEPSTFSRALTMVPTPLHC